MDFTESDLTVVGKIQEMRNCTVESAKQLFRKHVLRLANQDAENRAELVLAAIERGVEINGNGEEAHAAPKQKLTRNERRLAARERKEQMKAKVKKAIKAVRKKKAVTAKKSTPRVECELAELSRDVELIPANGVRNVYLAPLFGRKHIAIWGERNRNVGASARFETVNVSEKQLDAAKKYAKENDLPVAVCITVRVLGKLDQGYAVPVALFEKFKQGERGFSLSGEARQAYGADGWDGCKFSEKAAEAKAA